MADISTHDGLTADQLPEEQISSNSYDLPTVDQILYGIDTPDTNAPLSVQEISAKVGIMYDRATWLLRRYMNSNGESTDRTLFASFFENCTNNITKYLREREFDKVIENLDTMSYSINKLALYEPETAKFIFPDGVDEAKESLELYASNIKALSKIEA